MDDEPKLEAVYYASPIPASARSLTTLSLVFDRLYFPGVYLPTDGYDQDALNAEIARIEATGEAAREYETAALVSILKFLPRVAVLNDFCIFTGTRADVFGRSEAGTENLVKELDNLIHGPPAPNFFPTYQTGFNKGLPGKKEFIAYPGPLHYPASALLYSARLGLPLVNDQPELPVPAVGGMQARNNDKILSAILAMECVSLVLPRIRPLRVEEIVEFRQENARHIKPFRIALLRLSAKLNGLITSGSTQDDIVDAAKFLVRTDVYPQLLEMQDAIQQPTRGWYDRSLELAKQVPELIPAYASMGIYGLMAKVSAALGTFMVAYKNDRDSKDSDSRRSGLYYLLRVRSLR